MYFAVNLCLKCSVQKVIWLLLEYFPFHSFGILLQLLLVNKVVFDLVYFYIEVSVFRLKNAGWH